MKSVLTLIWAPLVAMTAWSQTLPPPPGALLNIDILPVTSPTISPGQSFTFEVVTRLGTGGSPDIAAANFDYSIQLGTLATILFTGVAADGSLLVAPSTTYGTIAGVMWDPADADNDFIPSSLPTDLGMLLAGDTLDRPDPSNPNWDSDWVFRMTWTAPSDAPLGTYAVTGSEVGDLYFQGSLSSSDTLVASFPGSHTPLDVVIVPEPGVTVLALAGLGLLLRRRYP